jgi:hypothetical protein
MNKIVLIVSLIALAISSCNKEVIVPNVQSNSSPTEEAGDYTLKCSSDDDVVTSDYNDGEVITDPNSDVDEDRRKGKGK